MVISWLRKSSTLILLSLHATYDDVLHDIDYTQRHKPEQVLKWELTIVFVTIVIWIVQYILCLHAFHNPHFYSILVCSGMAWIALIYPLWIFTFLIPFVILRWVKRYYQYDFQ